MNFCPYSPHLLYDVGEIRHKVSALMLLSICECREKRHRKSRQRSGFYTFAMKRKDLV
jgi:hypothetical protein